MTIAALAPTASVIYGQPKYAPEREYVTGASGRVARIHVTGAISSGADPWSGVDTYGLAAAIMEEAAAGVPIELVIDSPGGSVVGMDDLCAAIREARTAVPVTAYVRGSCCSGALWMASACERIVASPLAMLGSVGVIWIDDPAPVPVSVTNDGALLKRKGVAEAPEMYQALVNDNAAMFHQALADGRGLTRDDVIARFGDGSVFSARRALELGLIDEVAGATQEATEMQTKPRAEAPAPTSEAPAPMAPPAELSEIEKLKAEKEALDAKIKNMEAQKNAADAEAAAAKAALAGAEARALQVAEDAAISGLLASGKLTKGGEADARKMYQAGPEAFAIFARTLGAVAQSIPTERQSSAAGKPQVASGRFDGKSLKAEVMAEAKGDLTQYIPALKRVVARNTKRGE